MAVEDAVVGRLEDVTVKYRSMVALRNATVAIPKGVTLVMGPNGSGKSTLVKTLLGLIRPASGRVELFGLNPFKRGSRIYERVTYISEQDAIPPEIRVGTHLELLESVYGVEEVRGAARLLGLEAHLGKRYSELSRGLQRRLALVEALASRRELIIVDDPMIGMDSRGRELIGEALAEKVEGDTSIIVITHILIPKLRPDYLVRIEDGRITYQGAPENIG